MFKILKTSSYYGLLNQITNALDEVVASSKDLGIARNEVKKHKDEAKGYATLLLQIYNGAEELKLLHQHRLDAVKDKKGPRAVIAANEEFNAKFQAFMDLCIKGKSPADG